MKQGNIPTPPNQFGSLFPNQTRGYLIALLILLALGGYSLIKGGDDEDPGLSRPGSSSSVTVEVDRVVDGDTAKVFYDGRSEYVRYIGIDTPESVKSDTPVECYGEEAKRFNAELLAAHPKVTLAFDREKRDKYGRLLAYVYSGSTLLNAELLRGGYATTLVVRPNDYKADQFAYIEDEARKAGRGLWSAC